MAFTLFSALYNALDYPLRQHIHWRRAGLRISGESKAGLFSNLAEAEQAAAKTTAQRLNGAYRLQRFRENSSRTNYRENLFYLEMLETALDRAEVSLPASLHAVDVGTSHWFYVQALHALLTWWNSPQARRVTLRGYENDAYRVYADRYSRYDHAVAHMAGLPGVSYIPAPFTPAPDACDFAAILFPFIFLADHLRWGLPRRLFDPPQLISGVWQSLKENGLLVIANQGEREARALERLLAQRSIPICAAFRYDSRFFDYDLPRYVTVCVKR